MEVHFRIGLGRPINYATKCMYLNLSRFQIIISIAYNQLLKKMNKIQMQTL